MIQAGERGTRGALLLAAMTEPKKRAPREQGTPATKLVSYIRSYEADDVCVPATPPALGSTPEMRMEGDGFLDDWALRHFTVSVKMHDVERLSDGDGERFLVLADLAIVQGVLLELHDFASGDQHVRGMMDETTVLQNGVSALYSWLDDVLDAAAIRVVARNKPGFVDVPSEEAFAAILRTLERVHPDLETLVRVDALGGPNDDVARKIALCFRQIGAAVVRISGRGMSSLPPR